ncbi:hypothetical protein LOC68_06125 [Blastopirellula sp. JC732]|uniref:Uncharacterized protein n=1 Tax=Blastopirellula sediminis TaxID=2894196 RepID=A0A9X1MKJ6_9BACT|nr:hypothetical protein [Blastopirellula sediminis]MCC9609258.1 hypothetical protein [Blastopirellula sediminis]MCC9627965.1 hypothetical protein [Blastopirellula sediminis]
MFAMILLFALGVCGIIQLGCFIMIIIKMFQNDEATLAIVCLATIPCALLGFLIAFIMGWVKADKLGARQIMGIWTAMVVINIIASFLMPGGAPALPQ